MTFNSAKRQRESIRLKNHDYTQAGAYFVTICASNRECLFGTVGEPNLVGARHAVPLHAVSPPNAVPQHTITTKLSDIGQIILACWLDIPKHFHHVEIDEFVVMPNHIHGIVILNDREGGNAACDGDTACTGTACRAPTVRDAPTVRSEHFSKPVPGSLPTIIRSYKSASSKRVNELRNTPGQSLWQRSYYEHIVRNEADYLCIAEYIQTNPLRWEQDALHPSNDDGTWTANGKRGS